MKRRVVKKHRARVKKALSTLSKLINKTAKVEFLSKAEHNEQMRAARRLNTTRKKSRKYKK